MTTYNILTLNFKVFYDKHADKNANKRNKEYRNWCCSWNRSHRLILYNQINNNPIRFIYKMSPISQPKVWQSETRIWVTWLDTNIRHEYILKIEIKFISFRVFIPCQICGWHVCMTRIHELPSILQTRNHGTIRKINVGKKPNVSLETTKFKRIYICLASLKQGFKYGKDSYWGPNGLGH